ncbi:MAG: peptide-methionine (S)-S-oxide reductase MsrA, partial [bacterium]
EGEGFTDKNVRYCVNSVSLNFAAADDETMTADSESAAPVEMAAQASATMEPEMKTEKAYFAGGCFWGVEYYLEQIDGVLDVRSGYMGGHVDNPTYKEVCSGTTGHAETVEVEFDPTKTDYETVAKTFFEIHDPTQVNRQGPDVGEQYRSAVFYANDNQKQVADSLIEILKSKGLKVSTEVAAAGTFWPAEDYHQDYYEHTGKQPYCHAYTKRF